MISRLIFLNFLLIFSKVFLKADEKGCNKKLSHGDDASKKTISVEQ
jgi:hypothetical protein